MISHLSAKIYFTTIVAAFNQAFKEAGIEARMDFGGKDEFVYDEEEAFGTDDNPGDGRLYDEAIETAREVIKHLLAGTPLIVLHGLMQSGKTLTQGVVLAIYPALLKVVRNVECFPILLTPGDNKMVDPFRKKVSRIFNLLGDGKIKGKYGTVKIRTHHREVSRKIKNAMIRNVQNGSIFCEKKRKKIINGINGLFASDCGLTVINVRGSAVGIVGYISAACNNEKVHLLVDRDESHYGIAENSVSDRMFEGMGLYEGLYNDRERSRFQLIVVSATNFPWRNFLGAKEVKVRVSPGYVGPQRCSADFFDDNVTPIDVRDIEEFGYENDLDLRDLIPREYDPENNEECIKKLAALIRFLLLDENPNNGRGILLRYIIHNPTMLKLIDQLEEELEMRIEFIKFFDDSSGEDIREKISQVGDKPYVVVATGSARMGISFPADCCYGVDLTEKTNKIDSLLQGMVGRMSGNGKRPLVLLSSHNAAFYWQHQFGDLENSTKLSRSCRAVPDDTFFYVRREHSPRAAAFIDELNREYFSVQENGKYPTSIGANRCAASIIRKHFTDAFVDDLEEIVKGIRLLRPGQTDDQGNSYEDSMGASLRSDTALGRQGGGKSDRNARRVIVRTEKNDQTSQNTVVSLGFRAYQSEKKIGPLASSVAGKVAAGA